ncbi:MAG: hypothetical protein DA408_07505 [Bacteroidetes bacterium]|nr:MAG: hypothetical protein C7N36_03950 [Bacteroidota bacterium]PTM13230.1 MAG: hypothetical protein DA408_07505 [Bacteroidota bacterium]
MTKFLESWPNFGRRIVLFVGLFPNFVAVWQKVGRVTASQGIGGVGRQKKWPLVIQVTGFLG